MVSFERRRVRTFAITEINRRIEDRDDKDPDNALKKVGVWLEGAAKWSVTQLKEGTQASVEAVKNIGKDAAKAAKAGAEEVDKLFKGIGEGIEDVGRKL